MSDSLDSLLIGLLDTFIDEWLSQTVERGNHTWLSASGWTPIKVNRISMLFAYIIFKKFYAHIDYVNACKQFLNLIHTLFPFFHKASGQQSGIGTTAREVLNK